MHLRMRHTTDKLLSLLAEECRREIVRHLSRNSTSAVSLDELVSEISNTVADSGEGDSPTADTLRIELHHKHLPKLDAMGILDYDPRSHTVRYQGSTDVEALLRAVEESGRGHR